MDTLLEQLIADFHVRLLAQFTLREVQLPARPPFTHAQRG